MKFAPKFSTFGAAFRRAGGARVFFLAFASVQFLRADETKPKKETILPVGVIQIALMTLNAHVTGYGSVESTGATDDPDPAKLIVIGTVPVDDAAGLKLGRPVEISTSVANSNVNGTLLFISPRVDPKTAAVAVRASLPADAGFRPGQFVKLNIATEEHRNILAVLVECLVKDPDVGYVVSFVEGNIATQIPVRVGIRDGDFVEIEGEGIKVGQTVVSSGAYALPKVTKVRIITPIN